MFIVDRSSILPGRARKAFCRRAAAVVFERENGLVSNSLTELAKKPNWSCLLCRRELSSSVIVDTVFKELTL